MRNEQEIFEDLKALCASPGYAHVIAWFCVRDHFVLYADEIKPQDLSPLYNASRLITTETAMLVALLAKVEIDFELPESEVYQRYCEDTERLLEELHETSLAPWKAKMAALVAGQGTGDEPESVEALDMDMREAIFYNGESAYSFQYRDMAPLKYARDRDWLIEHKGFDIDAARSVVCAILAHHNEIGTAAYREMVETQNAVHLLTAFEFEFEDVVESSGVDPEIVARVLDTFTFPQGSGNPTFTAWGDYSGTTAAPILRNGQKYVLFQYYVLVAALYETPVYWLTADKAYKAEAFRHRGQFAEDFALERLIHVFGKDNVHINVHIPGAKGETLGEIDVLVFFAGVAIVVQAKTRRLSLDARKGDGSKIEADFKAAVQDSYDQAYECSRFLLDPSTRLLDADKNPLVLPLPVTSIYPVCLVAGHYPALALQAREFLKTRDHANIHPPLVIDVFALDAVAEMLESPLRFLSYLKLRARFGEKLAVSHEFTLLSDHIKRNLWYDGDYTMIMLGDDISTDLEAALMVRREGVPGKRTPDGILTRFVESPVGGLLKALEEQVQPDFVDLGLRLLELSERVTAALSLALSKIVADTRKDGKSHDLSMELGDPSTGLSLYGMPEFNHLEAYKVRTHCTLRKYRHKATHWYGLVFDPDGDLRIGFKLSGRWQRDADLERLSAELPGKPAEPKRFHAYIIQGISAGRNDKCPCGSGRKYKKCCLHGPA